MPGDRADLLAKASDRGADALILDLEDGVAPAQRAAAAAAVGTWVAERTAGGGPELWVRIDPAATASQLAAVVGPGLRGIVLPKAESIDQLVELDRMLAGTDLVVAPLLESATGMAAVLALAEGPRVHHLGMGEADLSADLGIDPSEPTALAPLRSAVVVASAAAGISPPIGPTSTDYTDLDALARSSALLRRQGFHGRSAIHPAQLAVVADAFRPTPAEQAWARKVLAAADPAGGSASSEGTLVDEAVLRRARRLLDS